MIHEVVPPTSISLIFSKKCMKVISQNRKFVFFVIHSQSEKKVATTSMAFATDLSMQQKQVDKVIEEYKYIFSSPTWIPLHYQVKHLIDMTPGALLPNGLVYHRSMLKNKEIKHEIQEILQKGDIRPNSSPCESPIVIVQKKHGTW
jgi:hypothetical protein